MSAPRIAVLMTCHNRRALTLRCLESLRHQEGFRAVDLFLVDDGSNDGTGDAVHAAMPGAQVIRGDGSLFWNGGMRLAWETAKAASADYDYFLWLNDDVVLAGNALAMLLADARASVPVGAPVIIAGATCAPDDRDQVTYGGHCRPDPARLFRLKLAHPSGKPQPIDTISGNIVLVSGEAERRLGNLTPELTHIFGDLDYGFRAGKAGVPMFLASDLAGTCAANDPAGGPHDPAASRLARLRARWQQRGSIHVRDWDRFVALHAPNQWTRLRQRVAPYAQILLGGGR